MRSPTALLLGKKDTGKNGSLTLLKPMPETIRHQSQCGSKYVKPIKPPSPWFVSCNRRSQARYRYVRFSGWPGGRTGEYLPGADAIDANHSGDKARANCCAQRVWLVSLTCLLTKRSEERRV